MIVLLLLRPALAADAPLNANLLAAGGVGVAASADNVGVTLNPGSIGLRERYDFGGFFGYGPDGALRWGGDVMDARTSPRVAAGFAYSGERENPPLTVDDLPGWSLPNEDLQNIRHEHDFCGAVAVNFLDRKLSIGFAVDVRMYDYRRLGDGLLGDGHLGLGVRPVKALELGVVGRNLVPWDDPFDRPPEVRGGARVGDDDRGWLEADGGWRYGAAPGMLFAAGGELVVGHGRIRAGFHREDGVNALSAGVGYTDTGGSVEYGIRVPVGATASLGAIVQEVSIRFSAPDSIDPE